MNNSKVLLKVEDFRAISKAEIKLDGITVVAGVNGCGKSTLSKLLYWVYRGATDFKVLADTELKHQLNNVDIITSFTLRMLHFMIQSNNLDEISFPLNVIDLHKKWLDGYQKLEKEAMIASLNNIQYHLENNNFQFLDKEVKKSFWEVFEDIFENDDFSKYISDKYNYETTFSKSVFGILALIVDEIFVKYEQNTIKKPRAFLDEKIKRVFHTKYLPTLLEISENELPIFKTDYEFLSEPYWIDNVIYIDTPMFFQNSGTEHWNDVNEKLKKRPEYYDSHSNIKEIDTLIKNEILTGQAEIKFNELNSSFTFVTPTGAEIDLSDSATGIKAFAVLDLLLKNKSINDKTLLILDEPEAHLHPQWIIEFGRLLTLIHKYIGAKVFVATHSPDMVQALRYIANKESIGERVNFYLAKADENKNSQFIYQDLNGEIDDIFSSFNISLDKLAKYGED